MTKIDVVLPKPHPLQKEVLETDARFKVVDCGRRWGKTRMAVLAGIYDMLHGGSVMWIAPSHQKSEIGWRLMERIALQIPILEIRRGDGRINSPNGGWIQVFSADSEGGVRGEGASLVVVDEAAHIKNLEDIWQQEIRPALSDRQGKAIFISTPNGYNFFYDLFRRSETDKDWRSWQYPTWTNPKINAEEIEKARKDLPELVFRQEYGAEFVQLAGAMFKREYFGIIDNYPELQAVARHWDLAASTKTMADYSVGVKVGLDKNGNAYILDVVRGRWEWPALIRVIRDTALADGQGCMQSVETAGTQKGMLDLLLSEPSLVGISISGIQPLQDKIARANTWLARAEQGKVKLVRANWNAAWLDEICSFPSGEHDDQVDATSGAFTTIGNRELVIFGV